MIDFTSILKPLGAHPFRPEERIPPSEDIISSFEDLIGVALPGAYRDFLLAFAGTAFNRDIIADCVDSRIEDRFVAVTIFYGFYRPKNNTAATCDLIGNYQESRAILPSYLFTIASCPYGNRIAMSIGEKTNGSVYFLDHEEFHEDFIPSEEKELEDEELSDGIYFDSLNLED
jgi:hypothetical protein